MVHAWWMVAKAYVTVTTELEGKNVTSKVRFILRNLKWRSGLIYEIICFSETGKKLLRIKFSKFSNISLTILCILKKSMSGRKFLPTGVTGGKRRFVKTNITEKGDPKIVLEFRKMTKNCGFSLFPCIPLKPNFSCTFPKFSLFQIFHLHPQNTPFQPVFYL